MDVHLFTELYVDSNEQRNNELLTCLKKNISNQFTSIVGLVEIDQYGQVSELLEREKIMDKVFLIVRKGRPTFKDIFNYMAIPTFSEDAIKIFANTDIYFEALEQYDNHFEYLMGAGRTCFALSRWDVDANGIATHFERADSQDVWVFYGSPNVDEKAYLDFTAGKAGCDNRLAHELAVYGYNVLNPSKTFKTYHLHNSNVRNYVDEKGMVKERIEPPYSLVTPY